MDLSAIPWPQLGAGGLLIIGTLTAQAAFSNPAPHLHGEQMTIITSTADQRPVGLYATDEVVASTLPVDLATDTYRTMMRVIVPVNAGDLIDVEARGRVTNDLSYTVGVGYHLWAYDVDNGLGSSGTWWKISSDNGDNVDHTRHHMPLHTSTVYQVPADWPTGHRITVVFRADAHSTAWKAGNTLTVDKAYGQLTVRRWA